MINEEWVVAIIPAREGSRRVPLKNITLFRGKPLIAHAIDHAKASRYIDDIIVSSDSDVILQYAQPPIIPIKRPTYLATDHATSEAIIAHVLYTLPKLPDWFVLLQPTSPLRTAADIDTCLERAHKHSGQCISFNEYGKRNGAVYASSTPKFLSSLSLSDPRTGSDFYEMPNSRSLDIDYEQDFAWTADLKST